MAVSVPREIYTLGAVQFNTQPLAQLQAQLMAKKAAKEEALNKYYSDLQGKINLAGVRTQDLQGPLGGITQDVENWKQEWLKNKNEIAKGGLAQQQHLSKFQDILRKIDQSKNRAKTELELGKMKVEGKYDPDDDDLRVQQNIGYSIYDPRSYKKDGVTEFGIGDLSPSVPAFDAARQNQFFSFVQKGKELGEVADTTREPIKEKVGGKETGWVIVPVKKEYSRDQIIRIANDAAELVKSIDPNNPTKAADVSARKYYSKVLNNPQGEEFVRLKTAYDKYFGGIMDTPEEVAKAAAAIKAEGAGQTTTRRVNPDDWREKAFLQAFLKGQGTQGGQEFVNYFDEIKNLAANPSRVKRGTGAPLNQLSAGTQTQLVDFAKKITGNQDINQSNIYVKAFPDGNIYIVDADTNETITPITERDINIPRQVAVAEKREASELAPAPKAPSKESVYTIKGKRYKEGELIKMGYTKQQIAPYLNK